MYYFARSLEPPTQSRSTKEMTRENSSWKLISRIGASIAGIIGVVVGGIAISQHINAPKIRLEATVSYGAYVPRLHPKLIDDPNKNHLDQMVGEILLELARTQALGEINPERARLVIEQSELALQTRRSLSIEELPRSSGGYWSAVVENRGTIAAQEVRLRLPNIQEAVMFREFADGFPHHHAPEVANIERGTVTIGELTQNEKVLIFCWTEIEPGPFPSPPNINIFHKNGTGDLTLLIPTSHPDTFRSPQSKAARFFIYLAGILLLSPSLLLVALLLAGYRLRRVPKFTTIPGGF